MKKLILIGRVAAGKTTLTQALNGEDIHYYKTQYINYLDTIIDTPGEYTELRQTSGALALYAYEADVVGLVLSANEPYSIFSPCITSLVNREVIGIITGIDKPDARPDRVERWLRLAGCKKIFPVSAYTVQGCAGCALRERRRSMWLHRRDSIQYGTNPDSKGRNWHLVLGRPLPGARRYTSIFHPDSNRLWALPLRVPHRVPDGTQSRWEG